MLKTAIAAALALFAATTANAASSHWVETWGASPTAPTAGSGPFPASPSFNDQTVRQIVRISAGGTRVRVRLTNEYGAKPLHIGAAHLALAGAGGAIKPGSDHVLTFSGRPDAVIPPGAPLLSDPVDLAAAPLSSLAVSLYLPGDTGQCTCHPTGAQTAYVSDAGDASGAQTFQAKSTFQSRAFLSGVDVLAPASAGAVVILGDSISDGAVSTPDLNHRWPDRLAERLAKRTAGGHGLAVVNEGISGNRVLADGAGQAALVRFDRDVLAVPGARYVVVFEGVNDLGLAHMKLDGPAAAFAKLMPASSASAADMIAGYKQLIARAHGRGLKIIGATITPYEGAAYFSPEGEADREAINTWIRTGGAFDGVIDFDAAWRDPVHPHRIRENLQPGDHLHGNDTGYKVLGDSINLSLFK